MTGLFDKVKAWFKRPINRWIARKLPPAQQVQLGLNSIMILPTRLGFVVLGLIVLLLLLAINYESSMVFALCFALLAVWLLALHWTFQSLSGLTLRLKGSRHVHAGDDLGFDIEIGSADQRPRYAIELYWQPQQITRFDVPAHALVQQQVFYPTTRRGYLQPERLQVVSCYPLMLFRAWSSVAFNSQALVYPTPTACDMPEPSAVHSNQSASSKPAPGFDELASVRPYRNADPLHHIAWKASAKRPADLVSKQFEQHQDQRLWLNYHDMPGPDHESKLSQLCYLCLQYQQQPIDFGLILADGMIAPDRGAKHMIRCLTQLALQPYVAGIQANYSRHADANGGHDAATTPR
ncbi:DUF58 domain-containing protein [Neiella marina]|uniref:DUF58 domain-containing protein n=1 Tax=Neiella holothuriorum TaxID=2870530 RepID=A0ABS7EED1_9GAMM|nr:DUF58 domain-containing protein [Neiella holothuriorum]MBW8190595.1 DUF58 domain-containing protein [Neiella holothuriorum]